MPRQVSRASSACLACTSACSCRASQRATSQPEDQHLAKTRYRLICRHSCIVHTGVAHNLSMPRSSPESALLRTRRWMSRCETTLSPEYPKLVPLKSAAFLSPSPLLKLLPAAHPSECLCASDPDGPNHLQAVGPLECMRTVTRAGNASTFEIRLFECGAAARPRRGPHPTGSAARSRRSRAGCRKPPPLSRPP